MDSDDYSSVGSGSARSITTTTAKSSTQTQDLSTPTTTAAIAAANDSSTATTTPERPNSLRSTSLLSVAEAEDVAKEMAKALEETLSQSHSSSLVDDTVHNDFTMDANMMVSPPLRPRQLVMRSSPTATKTNNNSNNNSPSNNSRELAKVEIWDQHDAVLGSPDRYDYKASSPLSSPQQRFIPQVQWESMAPVQAGDEDYVPLQDFRKKVTSRSLGAGHMPVPMSKKRSWKTRRNRYIRAVLSLSFGIIVVGMVVGGSDMISLPFSVPMWNYIRVTPITFSSPTPAVVTTTTAKAQSHHKTLESIKIDVPNRKDAPILLEAQTTKTKSLNEPKVPKIDTRTISVPKVEVVSNNRNNKQAPKLDVPKSDTSMAPIPAKVEPALVQSQIPTNVAVKVPVETRRRDDNASLRSEPIKRERIPGRCFVPLGYLAFSKCRKSITKEKPLFNVHGLTDCMLQ